ncbi:uncharacterized protein P174DRAFT_432441 [Aspergillus novofumigatus IBT 16806]|uniref:Uncharacterized protein n=1 Tax=Aspergillus novofumigatus (strain IBT 16806) TaxID=1392255 RepID=A0A2I1C659_ASPN1|nr:uncharacterized protein P174DRAFT_432441 [Aspergillus novofumigatus IBT 16806]PKX93107.1 hypothetical protein P174DRAFT_432441 [Aspergillus novofumigatus IBT 16806]
MALVIELGQDTIHLSHSNSDLSLMLRASLDISLSGNLNSGRPEDLNKLINSGLIWISQSPEIKMHVVVTTRSHFSESVPSYVSHVGDIIRKSKVRYHGPKTTYTAVIDPFTDRHPAALVRFGSFCPTPKLGPFFRIGQFNDHQVFLWIAKKSGQAVNKQTPPSTNISAARRRCCSSSKYSHSILVYDKRVP